MREPILLGGGAAVSRRQFLIASAALPVAVSVPSAGCPEVAVRRPTVHIAPLFVPEDTYPFFTEALPTSGNPAEQDATADHRGIS